MALLITSTNIVYWAALICLRGYVLVDIWSWFVVPTFDLPALSIPAALGVSAALKFSGRGPTAKEFRAALQESNTFLEDYVAPLLYILVVWAYAYIISLFM